MCSAPTKVGGRLHPCDQRAVVIVDPDADGKEKPLCAKHFKDFTAYYEDAPENKPGVKHL